MVSSFKFNESISRSREVSLKLYDQRGINIRDESAKIPILELIILTDVFLANKEESETFGRQQRRDD
jgi:hypothetical protein